jgi:hypothetical protein
MLEGLIFAVVLAFGFGGGEVYQIEKHKQKAKQECAAQCAPVTAAE